MAPAFGVGALDADEREFLHGHMAACDLAHRELREAVVLAAVIAEALSGPWTPSRRLRHQVLAAARADVARRGLRQADILRDAPSS